MNQMMTCWMYESIDGNVRCIYESIDGLLDVQMNQLKLAGWIDESIQDLLNVWINKLITCWMIEPTCRLDR